MKRFKSFILMAIFTICCFAVMGVVKAAGGPFTFSNYQMICEPSAIEAGGTAKCYLFAQVSGGDTKLNGFVSVIYTNDNLLLDGVEPAASEVASAKLIKPGQKASEAGITVNKYVLGETGVAGGAEFQCDLSWMDIKGTHLDGAGADKTKQVITESNKNDSYCALYYSGTDDAVFDTAALYKAGKYTDAFKDATNRDKYAILGVYKVKLDKDMPQGANRCGDICVKVWTVPQGVYYSQASSCGTGGENCAQHTTTEQKCTEIHIKADGETETGAFASYTILAAAAFIAISAVAIAKKNKKLYKI